MSGVVHHGGQYKNSAAFTREGDVFYRARSLPAPWAVDILRGMAAKDLRMTVEIVSSQEAVRVPRKRIAEVAAKIARQEGIRVSHIEIAVAAEDEMAAMNRRYLHHAGATDVLSFDLSDDVTDGLVGQVVVCGDVAAREAPIHGHSAQRELLLYVIHGLLHLTGYDDKTPRLAARMHAKAEELLAEVYPLPRRQRGRS